MSLNIVFAGTPDFAAHHLQALINSEHNIVGIYTQPDRPANRGKSLQSSPVKQLAEKHQLPVFQPLNFQQAADVNCLAELQADLMIVVAYGLLLPQSVLDTPRLGCINVHASLLPRWRGAAPIQRAIEAGDTETGITIMQMDIGLDTGDMLLTCRCDITATDTGGSLHDKLLALGGPALLESLHQLESNQIKPIKQNDNLKTYAHKFNKADASINWDLEAAAIDRLIRAYNPFPMAHCGFEDKGSNQRLRILAAELGPNSSTYPSGTISSVDKTGLTVCCGGHSSLRINQVQLPGKKPMAIKDLLNGRPDLFLVGQQFH